MRFKRPIHCSLEFNMVFSINGVYLVVQTVKNLPTMQETQVQSLGWENPLDFGYLLQHSSLGNSWLVWYPFSPRDSQVSSPTWQFKSLHKNNFKILLIPAKAKKYVRYSAIRNLDKEWQNIMVDGAEFINRHVFVLSCFSLVWLFATPWNVSQQSPVFMGFPSQEYWSGLPSLPSGDLPNQGLNPCLFCLLNGQEGSVLLVSPGKPEFLSMDEPNRDSSFNRFDYTSESSTQWIGRLIEMLTSSDLNSRRLKCPNLLIIK